MRERRANAPYEERIEWDRDGQYYHYLTKWMHALNCVSRVTGCPTYKRWAIELAKTAHTRFTYDVSPGGEKLMYWKMSIDLSRPLVPFMGQHDPLDGMITYEELQATSAENSGETSLDLKAEIADMEAMCEGRSWVTSDPLGIGGLLTDAHKVGQLIVKGNLDRREMLEVIVNASLPSLEAYARKNILNQSVDYRLAFRELGTSIGLRAAERLLRMIGDNLSLFEKKHLLYAQVERLTRHLPLGTNIESFWLKRSNQESNTWLDHLNINMVMLATSLTPDAYLAI